MPSNTPGQETAPVPVPVRGAGKAASGRGRATCGNRPAPDVVGAGRPQTRAARAKLVFDKKTV